MIGLVVFNLLWIIIDTLFGTQLINQLIETKLPAVFQLYSPIHANFILIDLVFVGVFLSEFILRWALSIRSREYMRWYFFPFAHWYDLIGCIPVGAFRALRFLRLLSICYRLQKHKIVDFTELPVFSFFIFYYNVLIEELSDRIVINVLTGAQKELARGAPLFDQIINNILLPRKQLLVDWLSDHIEAKTTHILVDKRETIRQYIEQVVSNAVRSNDEIERIKHTPFIGSTLANTLNDTISDIVYKTFENILLDLSSKENKPLVAELTDTLLSGTHTTSVTDEHFREMLIEIVEALKSQVSVQHWKNELH